MLFSLTSACPKVFIMLLQMLLLSLPRHIVLSTLFVFHMWLKMWAMVVKHNLFWIMLLLLLLRSLPSLPNLPHQNPPNVLHSHYARHHHHHVSSCIIITYCRKTSKWIKIKSIWTKPDWLFSHVRPWIGNINSTIGIDHDLVISWGCPAFFLTLTLTFDLFFSSIPVFFVVCFWVVGIVLYDGNEMNKESSSEEEEKEEEEEEVEWLAYCCTTACLNDMNKKKKKEKKKNHKNGKMTTKMSILISLVCLGRFWYRCRKRSRSTSCNNNMLVFLALLVQATVHWRRGVSEDQAKPTTQNELRR